MYLSTTVNDPFQGKLSVTFIPQCDFKGAEREVVVSTRYVDSEVINYDVTAVRLFDGNNQEPWTWECPLLDRSKRTFKYKVDVINHYDTSMPGNWQEASGDEGTILVGPAVRKKFSSDNSYQLPIPVFLTREYWQNHEWNMIVIHLHYEYGDEPERLFLDNVFNFFPSEKDYREWMLPVYSNKGFGVGGKLSYKVYAYAEDATKNKVIGPFMTEGPFVAIEL
jgi:hypothetical protein